MPRRRDTRSRARARPARHDRDARGRQALRPRNLEYRAAGRARLSHRLQSASCAREVGRVSDPSWLALARGSAPLIVSMPHTGNGIPDEFALRFISTWLARKDADWWIERLYDFAGDLGATILRTTISRSVIDVNRDPAGRSLYPGQATTELCTTTSFEGEKLYYDGLEPDEQAIARRREQ